MGQPGHDRLLLEQGRQRAEVEAVQEERRRVGQAVLLGLEGTEDHPVDREKDDHADEHDQRVPAEPPG